MAILASTSSAVSQGNPIFRQFFYLVERLRIAQKAYFADRSDYNLKVAKALEKDVDDRIVKLKTWNKPKQPTLFDEPTTVDGYIGAAP